MAVAVAVPLLLGIVVLWVFLTAAGRDTLLSQAQRFVPPDSLSWSAAEGSLSGGLVLHDLLYRADGVSIRLARVELDLSATALLAGEIHIRRLLVSGGQIDLPAKDATAEPWPDYIELRASLPDLVFSVAIRADRIKIEDVQLRQGGDSLLQLTRLTTAGELINGRLRVRGLSLDSDRIGLVLDGYVDTARAWASELKAQARLPLDEVEPLPLDLALSGNIKDLHLRAQADTGQPAELRLRVRGGLSAPVWALELDAPQVDLQRLGASGEAVALTLRARGDLKRARLEGQVSQGELAVVIAPSQLGYADSTLSFAPLAFKALDGEIELSGDVDGSGAQPQLALVLDWRDVRLPSNDAAATVRSQGQARLAGLLDDYALDLEGRFARAGDEARVKFNAHGSLQEMTFNQLKASLPTGSLQAQGKLGWEPQVRFTLDAHLDDFDPSFFLPDLPGTIAAGISLDGGLIEGEPYGTLQLTNLSGELRGKPLSGRARIAADKNGHGEGELQLGLGGSKLAAAGHWDHRLNIDVDIQTLQLADIAADADGQVSGTLALRGTRTAPEADVRLDGAGITFAGQSVSHLLVRASLDGQQRGRLNLKGESVTLAGQDFDTLSLSADGDRARHDVDLTLDGAAGNLVVALEGGLDASGERWQGRVSTLNLEPAEHEAWRLREPAGLAIDFAAATVALDETCLDAAPAWLCSRIDTRGGAMEGEIALHGLELSLLDPILTAALNQPLSTTGSLSADARFTRDANGVLRGQAQAGIPAFSLGPGAGLEGQPLALSNVDLNLQLDPEQAELTLTAVASDSGHLRARMSLSTPFADDGALAGEIDLLLPELSVLGLFSDQVSDPVGRIEGRLTLAGTRIEPRFDGVIELLDFAAELPALGISPHDGHITVHARDTRALDLSGNLGLGEGVAQLKGRFEMTDEGLSGALEIKGENLTVVATPEVAVRASPDLTLDIGSTVMKLRGSVTVPWARIDLERLESVATPSPDVFIVDAEETRPGVLLDSDISVVLGEDVRLSGFGLKGTLVGQLRVRDQPGRATTARGSVEVGGRYKAYGQDLTITRGYIAWAGTPLDTPTLEVRAQRKIDAITVGVQVRGVATAPELSLWSTPAMEQAEQLSYLVLGRPLRSASQAEGSQLSQAAAAMGGNLLAKNLGARLGLDEVEVADSRALGGAALTVGTYLSPRLHVSYGVALFGTGQVITFKYVLNHLWTIQLDSGTEDRAALNYRLER